MTKSPFYATGLGFVLTRALRRVLKFEEKKKNPEVALLCGGCRLCGRRS